MSDVEIKQVRPFQLSSAQWVNIATMIMDGFSKDPLTTYAYQSEHELNSVVIQTIKDPRDRLQAFRDYNSYVSALALSLQELSLSRGYDVNVAWNTSGRCVGVAVWKYPEYMHPQLEQQLKRVGVWYHLRRLFHVASLKIQQFVGYLMNHSVMGSMKTRFQGFQTRSFEVFKRAETPVSELGNMTRQQLESSDLVYPIDWMVYLKYFVVEPEFHGHGVGKALLKYSLDAIPRKEPSFNSATGYIQGPQKFYMEATQHGKFLYRKFGFEQVALYEEYHGSIYVPSYYMVKSRSSYNISGL